MPSTLGIELGTAATLPEATSQMDVADFDGDGFDDIVITADDSTHLYVLFGDGEGYFRNADIAVTLTSLDSVAILLGDGEGGFAPAQLVPLGTGTEPTRLAVGDLNADGADDLVVLAPGDGQVLVVLSDP